MELRSYFEEDDGSLPEIELLFQSQAQVPPAFAHFFALGAVDATVGGARVWHIPTESERPFAGPKDAELVANGVLQPFHIVLSAVAPNGVPLPDLGVWVDPDRLTLDYRMGPEWGSAQVQALVRLLQAFRNQGASVAVPWWGPEVELAFQEHVGGT